MGAFILLALLDLRSHVGHCASVALESINVLVASEAKVGKLHIKVLVEQNILELEVTVNNSLAVQVLKSIENLMSKEPADILAHGAHELAEVEKQAALHVLHDNVDKVLDDTGAGLDNCAGVAKLLHVDDAGVLDILKDLNLVIHRNNGLLVTAQKLFF